MERMINMSESFKHSAKKKAVALTAAISVLLGGLFNSPADLTQDPSAVDKAFTPPTSVNFVLPDDDGGDDGDEIFPDETEDEEKKKSGGIRDSLRRLILRIPAGVRAVFLVPLWAIGWGLISGFGAMWSAFLSPLVGTAATWLAAAAVILAVIAAGVKALFPEIPLKKILSKKTVIGVCSSVLLLALADAVVPLFVPEYAAVRSWVRFAGLTVIFSGFSLPFFFRRKGLAA